MCPGMRGLDGVNDIVHLGIVTQMTGAVDRHRMMVAVRIDKFEDG